MASMSTTLVGSPPLASARRSTTNTFSTIISSSSFESTNMIAPGSGQANATIQLSLITVALSPTNKHCTTTTSSPSELAPPSSKGTSSTKSPGESVVVGVEAPTTTSTPSSPTSSSTSPSSPEITRTSSYNGVLVIDHSVVDPPPEHLSRSTSQSSTFSHILQTPTSTSPLHRISILPTIDQNPLYEEGHDDDDNDNDVGEAGNPVGIHNSMMDGTSILEVQPKHQPHRYHNVQTVARWRHGAASSSVPRRNSNARPVTLESLHDWQATLVNSQLTSPSPADRIAFARGEHIHSTFPLDFSHSHITDNTPHGGGGVGGSSKSDTDSDTESSSWSDILLPDERYHTICLTDYNLQMKLKDNADRNQRMLERRFRPCANAAGAGAAAVASSVNRPSLRVGLSNKVRDERESAGDWLKVNQEVNLERRVDPSSTVHSHRITYT
ncbi:hypothetical protein IAT40_003866 [Kwoniella sp. CBS 6097]